MIEPHVPDDEPGDADRAREAPPQTIEDVLASAAMAVLVLITAGNVLTRYFTDASFAWTEELSVIVMVVMMFAGAAGAALRQAHIRMDLLSQRGPAGWQLAARTIARFATALAFGVLAVTLARAGWDE